MPGPAAPPGGRRRPRRGRPRRTARRPCITGRGSDIRYSEAGTAGLGCVDGVGAVHAPCGLQWGGWASAATPTRRWPSPPAAAPVGGRHDRGRAAAGRSPRSPARRRRRPGPAVRPDRRGAAHARRPTARWPSCATSSGRGLPTALPRLDRTALRLAASARRVAPGPVAAIVRRRIRAETRGVVIPAADPAFARHVAARTNAGFDLNINLLGEAILGDDEAAGRLDAVCAAHPPARRHVRVGEDLGAVRRPRRARVRARGRPDRRSPAAPSTTSAAAQSPARLRQPRHGGVPRPPPDRRRLPPRARRTASSAGCGPGIVAAGVPPRLPRRRSTTSCAWAAARHAARRGAGQGAAREGRQPGDGATSRPSSAGGRRRRTRPRPMSTPATSACSTALLDAAAARRPASRRRQPQPVRRGVGARRDPPARGSPTASRSRCSRGWPRRRPAATRAEAGRLLLYTPVVADADFAASIAYLARRLDENAGAGELPAVAVHDHARLAGVGRPSGRGSSRAWPRATTCRPRRAGTRTARPSTARSTPTRRSPTSPTPTSRQPPTGTGSPRHLAADRPGAAPAARDDDRRHRRHRRRGPAPAPPSWAATSTAERRAVAVPRSPR